MQQLWYDGGTAMHDGSTLDEAGLLIKIVDGMEEQPDQPWHACLTDWCAYVDHVSGSLVNRRIPYLYSDEVNRAANQYVGFVLASDVRFACAFSSDLGSIQLHRGGCDGNASAPLFCVP